MVLRRNGQRLERRQTAASTRTWPTRLEPAAHPGHDGRSSRDGERVPQGGGDRDRPIGTLGPRAGKTGHRGDHRLSVDEYGRRRFKTGHRGDHRLGDRGDRAVARRPARASHTARSSRPPSSAAGTRWRSGRTWSATTASREVRERDAVRGEAARGPAGRSPRRDPHGAGRRVPGRLRRRADGARRDDGQVPPHDGSSS